MLTHTNKLLFAVSAGFVLAGSAVGQITIAPANNVVAGVEPSGAAMGDFDGNGTVDIATTVDNPDRIATLLNDGAGNYVPGPGTLLGASTSPQDLIAGDLNGDGVVDLAVAIRDPQGHVRIMINNGSASFSALQSVTVGAEPRGLAIGDHDSDGDMDLAVANREGNTASFLTNTGGGMFTAQTVAAGAEPRAAAFGDFDGDRDLDAAVTSHDSREIDIYTNNGGVFANSATLSTGGNLRPEGIVAFDVDNDGDPDIAAATGDPGAVSVYLTTNGTFGQRMDFATNSIDASQIAAADLDCDGLLDVIVSNGDDATVSVLRNTGGAFGPATVLAAGANTSELATGDIDGDTDIDFAVANGDASTVSVFENTTDCDGGGDPGDPTCNADTNNDNVVDVFDLLNVLDNFGSCPTQ